MATPNYAYEKRQRELAKKRKAEEKRQRKLNSAEGSSPPANERDARGPLESGVQPGTPPADGDSGTSA